MEENRKLKYSVTNAQSSLSSSENKFPTVMVSLIVKIINKDYSNLIKKSYNTHQNGQSRTKKTIHREKNSS